MKVAAEPFTDQAKNNGQTKDASAAPDTGRASPAPDTDQASAAPDAEHADSTVGSLDSLVAGATASPVSRFLPDASMARWAMRLATQPGTVARQAVKLSADLTSIALGSSEIAAPRRDRRFADPAWTGNPMLKRTLQMYLALGGTAQDLLADADLDWRDNTRLQFLLTNFIAASAPSNNPALNPAAWKAFIDSGGMSLVRGLRSFTSDMSSTPHIPTMVKADAFTLGKDLAVTPGSVVLRTDVFELIQYKPTTPTVHQFPLLMVPPMINKYYITDLAPGRSMLEFFISQGHQMFVISWRNPDGRARHWDMNTYGQAIADAMRITREITKTPKLNVIGLCAGGIMTSMVSTHLSATDQLDQLSSLCLGVTLLDMTEAGTTVSLMDKGTAAGSILASRVRGYMDGKTLAEVFAWLRPDDLIWSYWVNNYLEGKNPPPFDILYWNADTTRMPAALHRNFIEIAMANALIKPGAVTMLGSPVDLSKINVDSYVVAGIDDHISPWPSAYRATQLLRGNIKFVLSNSGHIAAMVNPPTNPKATFRVGDGHPPDHRDWLAKAETRQGSWWPDYTDWLESRSGGTKQAPKTLGSSKYPPLDPAPGTYILER